MRVGPRGKGKGTKEKGTGWVSASAGARVFYGDCNTSASLDFPGEWYER